MSNTLSLKPLSCCPGIILGLVEERQRRIRDDLEADESDSAFVRLCCLEDMRPVWNRLVANVKTEGDLAAVALTLSRKPSTRDRPDFEQMTDPERIEWLSATRNTLGRLVDLLDQAPSWLDTTPLRDSPDWLVREFVNMARNIWTRQHRGVESGEPDLALEDAKAFSHLFYNYAGLPPWGLREISKRILRDLEQGVLGTMTIRKPRDPKAPRAAYILRITFYLEETYGVRLTDEEVATVARITFDESATSAAIANKFRFRKEKVRILGQIQGSQD